jgi:cellulose biosynthesis protein BcsQ
VAQAQRLNPRLRGFSVVRNKYNPRSAGDIAYDRMLTELYAANLLQTTIPVRAALRDSSGHQQSIFRYSAGDVASVRNAFLDLVEELTSLDTVA